MMMRMMMIIIIIIIKQKKCLRVKFASIVRLVISPFYQNNGKYYKKRKNDISGKGFSWEGAPFPSNKSPCY